MTTLQREVWETCLPVYQRMGYPPTPNQASIEDQFFLTHNRMHLLDLCYARGMSVTELWKASIREIVTALEALHG
jgi:hypothetical protein